MLLFRTGHLMIGALAIHRHLLAAHRSSARMKVRCDAFVAAAAGKSLYHGAVLPLRSRLSRLASEFIRYLRLTIELTAHITSHKKLLVTEVKKISVLPLITSLLGSVVAD